MIDTYRFDVRNRKGLPVGLTTSIGGAVLLAIVGGPGSTITTQGGQLVWTCDRDGSALPADLDELARQVWCQHLENRVAASRKEKTQ